MAEGGTADNPPNGKNTMPQRGKVNQVVREWAVHEDGAFAYELQNEEITKHYGINRFNRRTVRDDIPIAKVVQSDEEKRLQEERFEQLQALRAQAEEDERVAQMVMEQQQREIQNQHAHKKAIEMTDEEYAKMVQEKEKKKYERYLEKKKQKQLKKEREKLEQSQQQRTEEARLVSSTHSGSTEGLDEDFTDLQLQPQNGSQPVTRVTPGGRIEDDGDFTDFYNLPENVDPVHRAAVQELQDEELAKLLQEQEHKRTKAEVDRNKLREIEEQDKRLAEIIQEQEKLKLKKAKQKKKQQEENRRKQEPSQTPPALPPRNPEQHDHRRYRRNSFIQSIQNGPAQEQAPNNQAEPRRCSQESNDGYLVPIEAANGMIRNSMQGSSDKNRQMASERTKRNVPSDQSQASRQQSRESVQNRQNQRQDFKPEHLPTQNIPDVERWLAQSQEELNRGDNSRARLRSDSENYPESPSPPGSYHSAERYQDDESAYAVSNLNFNIATAIDPTYTRRRHEISEETDRKAPIHTVSRSLPVEDQTMSSMSREDSFPEDGPGVINPFAPVQGHRRNAPERTKKSKKQPPQAPPGDPKQKGSCKQQ